MLTALDPTIAQILPELRALRHELHEHPEIRFEEVWTSDRIAWFLEQHQIPYSRGHAGGTGIVAWLEGEAPGPVVALRADIDALEIQEETGLPYASRTEGRMHACGHDGHATCLAGAAKVLSAHRNLIRGKVKFIFQPAEEQAAGGRLIVEEGLLDDASAAFALHAWPQYPVGSVGVGAGCVMAGADFLGIRVRGKGGHGAYPASTVDPIVVAAHIVTALQTIVSRETTPWTQTVVSVARISAGTTSNIIPDEAWMEGTFRTLSESERSRVMEAIQRIVEHTAAAFRATAEVSDSFAGYPPTINHPQASALAADTVQEAFGGKALIPVERPFMTAEDFSFYLQKVPGAFVFLGNAEGEGESPGLHTSRFNFNDNALPVGVKLMSSLAIRYLNSGQR